MKSIYIYFLLRPTKNMKRYKAEVSELSSLFHVKLNFHVETCGGKNPWNIIHHKQLDAPDKIYQST